MRNLNFKILRFFIIPIILVAASGLIWGLGEAIDICATVAITEVALFSYYWWQIPSQKSNLVKATIWLGAIASGIALSINVI